jgi:thioredoxin 1
MSYACTKSQSNNTDLDAKAFQSKIAETPAAQVIDVRTPEEFSNGHIVNAQNMNWNGDFDKQIINLDKSKPVFVYCLSGGRSASAASKMRSSGFKTVYELNGGMMKWRAASLPEISGKESVKTGMSKQQFDTLLEGDKLVLIDFYAEWCIPCRKMAPYLDEIKNDMASKVLVIRIDADENQALAKELKVEALPVLMLFKNKSLIWSNIGFIEKSEVLKHLEP